jgi:glycosyl transferase family 87
MNSQLDNSRWPRAYRWGLIAFFLICILVGARQVQYYWTHGPVVSDLRIFMTGVEMMRTGDGHRLYQFEAQQAAQNRLYPQTRVAGLLPFNHLAYELLMYWPLAAFSYRNALMVWTAINLGVLFLVAGLLRPYTHRLRETTGVPLALWLLAFFPVLYVFGEGQDSLITLLIIVLSLQLLDRGCSFLAGLVLALALFKFHLCLLIAFIVFLLPRKWRAVAGFATSAAVVTGISRLMVGPNFGADYLSMLRNQSTMTPWGFIPWFMPNLRGFLEWSLSPTLDVGSILPLVLLLSLVVGGTVTWVTIKKGPEKSVSELFLAAVTTTLLVSYHMHMQDLTLAVLPMLLLLERALAGGSSKLATGILALSTAGFYTYRIAGEPFPILLVRGCVMALPLLLLWLAGLCMTSEKGQEVPALPESAKVALP